MFCQKIRTLSPFSLTYAYLDIPKYLADQIFIKNKIKVKFKEEFVKADTPYIVIVCSFNKNDIGKFKTSLRELENKMLIMGHTDYCKISEELNNLF